MKLRYQDLDLLTLNDKLNLSLDNRRLEHLKGSEKFGAHICDIIGFHSDKKNKVIRMCKYHDIARCLDKNELYEICRVNKLDLLKKEKENYILLHAPVGAFILKKYRFFSEDEYIYIDSVRKHTLWDNGSLEFKILKIVDFAEYSRDFKEANIVRELVEIDVDKAFLKVIELKNKYLEIVNERKN